MTSRIFDQHRIWRLDRPVFEEAVFLLAETIARQWVVDIIIGIARGGREPAFALASHLHLPVYEICARRNRFDHIQSEAIPYVDIEMRGIAVIPRKMHILLIDDICGEGETLERVCQALREYQKPKQIRSVTLCRNAGSLFTPDAWVWTVRDWVVFPWEERPPGIQTEPLPKPEKVVFIP